MTVPFTIAQKSIAGAEITLSSYTFTYNGTAHEPTVTGATIDGLDIDILSIAYTDNKDAGTATVTITGKGNFKGEATTNFTIEQKDIDGATITLSQSTYTYDGNEHKPITGATLRAHDSSSDLGQYPSDSYTNVQPGK